MRRLTWRTRRSWPASLNSERARVVARVGYNAVREGDCGVVVGPCNMRTMPNAPRRVLVNFGTGKGIYNYAAGTQLDIADSEDD